MNQVYLKTYMRANALSLEGWITVKEENWDILGDTFDFYGNKQLVCDISDLLATGVLSDFTFKTEDGRQMEVHKAVLACE